MLSKTWHSAALEFLSAHCVIPCLAAAACCPAMPGRKGDVPCPALFDLRYVELEEVVEPCDQLLPIMNFSSACVGGGGTANA